LAALAGCEGRPRGETEPPRPNLLLITVASLRADALGSYGQKLGVTPNLDALAQRSVSFEQCAASAPDALASLATLFTGRLPIAHGVRDSVGFALPEGERTLAEVFAQQDYRTGAEVGSLLVGARSGLAQGFSSFRDPDSPAARRLSMVTDRSGARTLPERSAADVTRLAREFLESHVRDPFFLWVHYADPSALYAAPPEFAERLPDRAYHAEVLYTDAQIGELLSALDALGLRDRTWIAVAGSSGEALGEHGEYEHGFYLWQTTLRVPLLVAGPGLTGVPRRVAEPVRLADLAPTALELLDLPPLLAIQGVSLRPLAEGGALRAPLPVYAESLEPLGVFGSSVLRSLREGRLKYVHQLEAQLYDLEVDPEERRNLAAELPAERDRLRAALGALVAGARDGTAAAATLDAAERRALDALGLVPVSLAGDARIASLDLLGPDPALVAEDLRAFSLALRQLQAGHAGDAVDLLKVLRAEHPGSAPIVYAHAEALRRAGRRADTIAALREGVALASRGAPFAADLGALLRAQGELAEAESVLRRAIADEPCASPARIELAALLRASEREAESLELLDDGVQRCPASLALRSAQALALATARDPALRDGHRAAALALEVTRAERHNPAYLRALSAALAALGERPRALELAGQALRIAEARGERAEEIAPYRAQLAALERGEELSE
jgi:arylsulfatase A-like enzyme